MNLTLSKIASMCNGRLSTGSDGALVINNVVIDSREALAGSLFIAIIGDNDNGHKYVNSSFAQGAVAAVVSRASGFDNNTPNLIIVADTTQALGYFAACYRNMFDVPIVAITGSNGKTTIKEMLRQICQIEYGKEYVLASRNSFNNHWGMPLTLLGLNTNHKVVILEMGMNHSGELDYLSRIAKPTIAVVNNVLLSHARFFKCLEDIAHAKGEIYNGLIDGGVALLNSNLPYYKLWQHQLQDKPVQRVTFGSTSSSCYLKQSHDDGTIIIHTNHGEINTKLQVLGKHNQYNAVTATVLALQIGCSSAAIANGLGSFTGYKHRLECKIAINGALLVDDSYNANPDSVKAAILAIKNLPKPHWFIFGDLNELGEFEQQQHIEIGEFIKENQIDKLLTIGQLTRSTGEAYFDNANWVHFEDNISIANYCKEHLPSGATLLIKGSNSMQLWEIADDLTVLSN